MVYKKSKKTTQTKDALLPLVSRISEASHGEPMGHVVKQGPLADLDILSDLEIVLDESDQDVEVEGDEAQEAIDDLAWGEDSDTAVVGSEVLDLQMTDASLQDQLPSVVSASSDPLRRYLQEIAQYPLLNAEEEMVLALRLKELQDVNAAKILVTANLRLVVKIAFEYRNFYTSLLDLIQEGNFGLVKAVSKFDSTKGSRLGYYASWWIRSYILKFLLDNFRLVKVGTTQAQKKLYYHLLKEKQRLERQGISVTPKLIAQKLNVREKDVLEMEQRLSARGAEISLDAPVEGSSSTYGTSSATYLDFLEGTNIPSDELMAEAQMLNLLRTELVEFEKSLSDKEKTILHERLLAQEPKTLQELAGLYGFTRERARQIEFRLINKLRVLLESKLALPSR